MSEPPAPGDPDFDPRHRVVGAVILVLLGVVFLPMILSEERAHDPAAPAAEPAEPPAETDDGRVFISRVTPVEPGAPVLPVEKTAPVVPGAKAGPPPAAPPPAAPPEREAWLVRVGTFSRAANVKKAVARLRAEGYTPHTGQVDTPQGRATRVWVGPFKSRREAARAREGIRKEMGLDGLVVAAP